MWKKKILLFILIGLLLAGLNLVLINAVVASSSSDQSLWKEIDDKLIDTGIYSGLTGTGPDPAPQLIIARLIRAVLGFLGIIFLVLMIYGGFLWMTAGGNEEQLGKARKILTQAVIGLAIVLAGFAISTFVIKVFVQATTGAPTVAPPTP